MRWQGVGLGMEAYREHGKHVERFERLNVIKWGSRGVFGGMKNGMGGKERVE